MLVLVSTGACALGSTQPTPTPSCQETDPPLTRGDGTLRVLAGSELKDLAELKDTGGRTIIDKIRIDTGVTVSLSYVGTLDGVEQVISGNAIRGYDATWFPSNRYLDLQPDAKKRIGAAVPIMRSPVILGVRPQLADDLWHGTAPSWQNIADRAQQGELDLAMTDPAVSNSGFSALAAMATALSPEGGPITSSQTQEIIPQLQKLFSAQKLTAGSSGWLKDAYLKRMRDGTAIGAMINYESVLKSANAEPTTPEKLTLIYPADGVMTADYPLTLLTGATDKATADRAARNHRVVTDYLRREQVQREIMTRTHRRPIRCNVDLAAEFEGRDLRELPFPDELETANDLLHAFGNTIRKPARTIYVLDLSGSMATQDASDPTKLNQPMPPKVTRIEALHHALLSLTGSDTSLTGQFTVFHEREQVILLTFNDTPHADQRFDVPPNTPEPTLEKIRAAVKDMQASGSTAMYDALVRAYEIAKEPTDEARYTTIVLLSDGEVTAGRDLAKFRAYYGGLSIPQKEVPAFSILIGEGNVAELTVLSREITGGEIFDARQQDSLSKVFQEIRGYQ